MIKNYKLCREKAEKLGKVFVIKNNQPDAVLFSLNEYERFSELIEYLEGHEDKFIKELLDSLPKRAQRSRSSCENSKENNWKLN